MGGLENCTWEELESSINAHKENLASYKKALEHASTHGNAFIKDVTQYLIDEYNKLYGVADRELGNKELSWSSEAKALFRKPQGWNSGKQFCLFHIRPRLS